MRFQVPQFIEIEDKIFGPLTFKQFIYVAGGGGGVVACLILLPTYLAILVSIPIGFLAVALAFYKINNRPFINIMESAFKYFTSSKLYVWQREELGTHNLEIKTPGENRLEDMSFELEVKDELMEQNDKINKNI